MAFCTSCGTPVEGNFCQKCGLPVGGAAQPSSGPAQQAPPGFAQQAPSGFAQQPSQPVAYGPPPAGTRKKMGALGWILIGLGCFMLLIGALVVGTGFFIAHKAKQAGLDSELAARNPALAAAKLMAALNPDVEVVKVDDDRGTLTLRDKKSGKTVTMSADDVKNGKITFSNDETGEKVQFGGGDIKLPSWIPEYPGSKPEGAMAATGMKGEGGMVHFNTSDSVSKVLNFYRDELKDAGFKITGNLNGDAGDSKGGLVTAENTETGHTVMVTVGTGDNGTQVAITYGSK